MSHDRCRPSWLLTFFFFVRSPDSPSQVKQYVQQQRQMYTRTLLNLSPDNGKTSFCCVCHMMNDPSDLDDKEQCVSKVGFCLYSNIIKVLENCII